MLKWFDGKKTSIGAGCLLVAGILSKIPMEQLAPVADILQYVGMAFSGVGLAHKSAKAKK
jgi:hypothetical protein